MQNAFRSLTEELTDDMVIFRKNRAEVILYIISTPLWAKEPFGAVDSEG